MQEIRRKTVTLVLGGVRSGKSRYAQHLGERAQGVLFVATAPTAEAAGCDAEMRRKIERHRAERPPSWRTVEEPLELAAVLAEPSPEQGPEQGPTCGLVIVDCLTLFIANLLHAAAEGKGDGDGDGFNEAFIEEKIAALCAALEAAACDVVLVSNEVGSGVVPAFASGRRFRDALGELNQRVAIVADEVLLLVAGLPLTLKGSGARA
jgi:adenosylcobinamide kinase / adenosylcobinamide-phosphate guanylyltransferase